MTFEAPISMLVGLDVNGDELTDLIIQRSDEPLGGLHVFLARTQI